MMQCSGHLVESWVYILIWAESASYCRDISIAISLSRRLFYLKLPQCMVIGASVIDVNWHLGRHREQPSYAPYHESHTSTSMSESLIPNGNLETMPSSLGTWCQTCSPLQTPETVWDPWHEPIKAICTPEESFLKLYSVRACPWSVWRARNLTVIPEFDAQSQGQPY